MLRTNSLARRAVGLSYSLVDDIHSLVDDVPPFVPRKLEPVTRKATVSGLVFFGTAVSTLAKIGAKHVLRSMFNV